MIVARNFSRRVAALKATDEISASRRQVEFYCQTLVEAGAAEWDVNDTGEIELQLTSGEVYVFGYIGITRRR
ncbi:hypothetical protein PQR08_37545 [Caballeronia jiangsuensis]|uniref:Uncharacterized protein n=1 Tax=Caballeronia jiangsuensis TaxID=1458357 RepID=A0ABW9CX12_9BURK